MSVVVQSQNSSSHSKKREKVSEAFRQEGFFYTNPLLDCEPSIAYLPPFKTSIQTFIDAQVKAKKAKRVSVYFRQLNNGYSFGINEDWNYAPGGLVETSTMMQVLKLAVKHPAVLNEKITVNSLEGLNLGSASSTKLQIGHDYTVAELLSEMIINSDCIPPRIFEEEMNLPNPWKKTFDDLGIHLKVNASKVNFVSAKQYSSLFRVLYNASYLNRHMSSVGLDLMSRTARPSGMVSGVADEPVVIANKFGIVKNGTDFQLHETGIVYLAGNPYLLCIMTEGINSVDLLSIIQEISKITYQSCLLQHATHEVESMEKSKENKDILLSPLIDCLDRIQELEPFHKKIRKYVDGQIDRKEIENVSISFRHLVNGSWFEVNKAETYVPASLMKIPSMICILKASEDNPNLLDEVIKTDYNISSRLTNNRGTVLKPSTDYTVRELVMQMIIHSDNYAANLLSERIPNYNEIWNALFDDLGITQWQIREQPKLGEISVTQISLFYRILYNASYLNRENSEYALSILSNTQFEEGIKKGLGNNETAAIKYGEKYEAATSGGDNQLHDCGIVYYEDNPYLLCIMTKGNKMDEQAKIIQDISRLVYAEMQKQFPVGINH